MTELDREFPNECWVVICHDNGKPMVDYVADFRHAAMEHAGEASEEGKEFGPWKVGRYVHESAIDQALALSRKGVIEDCAEITLAIDSGRGNEKEIAKAIRALVHSTGVPSEQSASSKAISEARNELSDCINTWKGQGVDALDQKLYLELDRILGLFDAAMLIKDSNGSS